MAINNTVQSNPFKSLISGLQAPPITLPKFGPQTPTPNMSTPSGPKYAPPPTGLMSVAPKTPAKSTASGQPVQPQTVQPAPTGTTVAQTTGNTGLNTNPQIGGVGSGGTLNPNFNAQTSAFGTSQPVKGLFPTVASSLATTSVERNRELADKAQQIADTYGREYADIGGKGARAQAGYLTTGTSPVAEGNAAIIAQTTAAQQQALAQGGQLALSGIDKGLTAQSQAQSALADVAGLAPEATRYEAFGGGGLAPQQRASELAQQVRAGLISPQAAEQQLNSLYGGAGATFLNQALQGSGFNYNTATAQSAAQQSNVQQQGTAQIDIARQGLQQATQDYLAMTGAAQFAGQQSQAVSSILAQAGLNNVSSTDYNKALNSLKSRFGDTNFAALNAALREAQSAYAQILSTGGNTPTFNDQQAMAVLDISQPASAINSAIQQLENAVARRLQAQNSVRIQYEQNLGGNTDGYNAPNVGNDLTWDNL